MLSAYGFTIPPEAPRSYVDWCNGSLTALWDIQSIVKFLEINDHWYHYAFRVAVHQYWIHHLDLIWTSGIIPKLLSKAHRLVPEEIATLLVRHLSREYLIKVISMEGSQHLVWLFLSYNDPKFLDMIQHFPPPHDLHTGDRLVRILDSIKLIKLVEMGWPILTPDLLHRVVAVGGNKSLHIAAILLYRFKYDPFRRALPNRAYRYGRTPLQLAKRGDLVDLLTDAEAKAVAQREKSATDKFMQNVGWEIYLLCKSRKTPPVVSSLIRDFMAAEEEGEFTGLEANQALGIPKIIRKGGGHYRLPFHLIGVPARDQKPYNQKRRRLV